MANSDMIQVMLDKHLVNKLLNGLYSGAEGKSLKVIIDADGQYHINSKGLKIVLEVKSGRTVETLRVSSDTLFALLSREELDEMQLSGFADKVYFSLRDKYSPYFHSLADSIVLFSRAYYNSAIDD